MDTAFMVFKTLFMMVFGLSLVFHDKTIETDTGSYPAWTIAACQTPVIVLYLLLF